jgi:hypothetical protein
MGTESGSREGSDEHQRMRQSATAAHALKLAKILARVRVSSRLGTPSSNRNFVAKCGSKSEDFTVKLANDAFQFEVGKHTSA